MKSIELSHVAWLEIRQKLKQKHSLSTLLVRDRMRAKLGYVDRYYDGKDIKSGAFKFCVMLDFYDEAKYTLFIMQYGEYMDKKDDQDF